MAVSQTKMTRSLRIENQLKRPKPMKLKRAKETAVETNKLLYLIIKANKQHLVNKRKAKGARLPKSNQLTTPAMSKTPQEIAQQ